MCQEISATLVGIALANVLTSEVVGKRVLVHPSALGCARRWVIYRLPEARCTMAEIRLCRDSTRRPDGGGLGADEADEHGLLFEGLHGAERLISRRGAGKVWMEAETV